MIRACLGDQLHPDGDPDLIRDGAALTFYWYYRTRLVEGTHWLERVFERGPVAADPIDAALRRLRLASMYFVRSQVEVATGLLERGLVELPEVPDDRAIEVAECLIALAASTWMMQCFRLLGRVVVRLNELVVQTGDPQLSLLADILRCVARADEAPEEPVVPRVVELFHLAGALGNPLGQWMAALEIASLEIAQNPDEGARWIRRLLPIQVRLGNGGGSLFLEWLANHAALQGNVRRAVRLYAAGQAAARQEGSGWPLYQRTNTLQARAEAVLGAAELAGERARGAGLTLADVSAELEPDRE